MQWIKSHLNLVITIAVGVLGITGLVLGMVMSDTQEALQADLATLNQLNTIKEINPSVIEHANRLLATNIEQLEKARTALAEIGKHEPIVPDLFPKVEAANATAPFKFGPAYAARRQALLAMLRAVDAPTSEEVSRENEAIQDARRKAEREAALGQGRPRGVQQPAPYNPLNRPTQQQARALTPQERMESDAQARVSVRRANEGYMYASLASLDYRPNIVDASKPASIEEMWYAQMALWIQEDVLGALARVNERAAENLPQGRKPCVLTLPVKHLVNFIMGNYVPGTATSSGSGSSSGGGTGGTILTGAVPSSSKSAVFTDRGSGDGVDVIQFALELVVEAQRLPEIIAEINKSGFYTPVNISYMAQSPTDNLYGYIYGSQPVIAVRLDYEGCFLRSKYEKWMPETIKTAIESGTAGGAAAPVGQGGGGGFSPGGFRPGGGGGGRFGS